jgi:stromal interaction molecule 1
LERLAANTQFMAILGINNPIHKQKLALKAMDVVLFGAPKHHNYLKDVLLICSLLIAIVGVWFAYVQHKYSQSHLKKMMADMDSLQRAEEQLMGLQTELDLTRQQQQMVVKEKVNLEKKLKENESQIERSASYTALSEVWRISELEDQLKRVNEELRRAQNAGVSSSRWAPPVSLQQWLQLTHELEIRSFNAKRCAAELQLYAAKEGVRIACHCTHCTHCC